MPMKHSAVALLAALAALPAVARAQDALPPPPPPPAEGTAPPPPTGAAGAQQAPSQYGVAPYGSPGPYAPYGNPGGYGYPGYYPRARLIPYEGGPVPPNMQLVTRARTGLVVGGAVTFGVMYGLTAFAGLLAGASEAERGRDAEEYWLCLPILGPLAYGIATDRPSDTTVTLLAMTTVVQAGGFVMLLAGVLAPRQYLVPTGYARAAPPRWAVLPGLGAAGAQGATLHVAF